MLQLFGVPRRHVAVFQAAALSFAFAPVAAAQDVEYAITRTATHRVKATLEMSLTDPRGKVAEWYIYAPVAPNHGGQDGMTTTFTPSGKATEELSPLKRPVLLARITEAPKQLQATYTVEGTLHARSLAPRPAGARPVPDLDAAEGKTFTRTSRTLDFDGKAFQEWLDANKLRRGKDERDLAFAMRAYTAIRKSFTYVTPSREEKASVICRLGKSDCGGLSCVLVGTLRANGIPARMLFGRWATPQTDAGQGHWHVEAEFFANGIGWVPVDMSHAVTAKDAPEFAHFGNDPGNFITLFLDQDVELDTFVNGRFRAFGMQGPMWWWRGQAGGNIQATEKWHVTLEAVKP